jgi:putative DNA primase/helicase
MNCEFIPVSADGISAELKALNQWVLWRAEQCGGRRTKIPYSLNGKKASTSDSATWADFANVSERYGKGYFDGIGFVFAEDDDLTGIALDHCICNGKLEPKAAAIVGALKSYTEYSVSGNGLHIIARASVEQGVRSSSRSRLDIPVEIYSCGRYFTVTGNAYGKPASIAYAQNVIDYLREIISPAASASCDKTQSKENRGRRYLGNGELIQAAISADNSDKFRRLWNGDTSMYGGDHSRADAALLKMLLFWTKGDMERADCLFRESGLYREEKWDKRPDYRKRTFEFLMGVGRA